MIVSIFKQLSIKAAPFNLSVIEVHYGYFLATLLCIQVYPLAIKVPQLLNRVFIVTLGLLLRVILFFSIMVVDEACPICLSIFCELVLLITITLSKAVR